MSSRPAWAKEQVLDQLGIYSETVAKKEKKQVFSFLILF
jgi:hypothetical protein